MVDFPGFLAARVDSRWRGYKMEEIAHAAEVRRLTETLFKAGVGVVGVKCGLRGIYLATTRKPPAILGDSWTNRELWAEALRAEKVVSTTGAGDCAIAGFLTSVLKGLGPEEALLAACIAGAQNVRAPDAHSGLGTWAEIQAMMGSFSPRHEWQPGRDWRRGARFGLWSGPYDGRAEGVTRRQGKES